MKSLSIQTAQNVQLNFKVADIGERIIATLLDVFVLFGYYMMIMLIGVLLPSLSETFPIFFMMIAIIPFFFYNIILEYFMNGQTVGKRIRKIKVVKMDGTKASFSDHFLRWILRFVEIFMSSGAVALFTIILNGKGQRLGDLAANTTVISLKNSVKLNESIYTKIKDDHTVTYDRVLLLKDKDIEIIKTVLNQQKKSPSSTTTIQLVDKLSKKLESILGSPKTRNKSTFIKQVLEDYNYLTQKMD